MNKFFISIGCEEVEVEGDKVAIGAIGIGEFCESFHASLSYWNQGLYMSQWKEALNRLLQGEAYSAVVTCMYDPRIANFLFWWVMYAAEDVVYLQNHVLFLGELGRPFDEANIYSFIPERETMTEDGESISEWVVKLSAIKEFIDALE